MEKKGKMRLLASGIAVLVCLYSAPSHAAAVDYFLKIDGIDGDSTAQGHENEIQAEAFSWGTSNASLATAGSAGAGKVAFQDLHFTASTGKASPKLMLACASGKHIATATLTCRKAGGTQQEFLVVKLKDIVVSSYQTGGSAGDEIGPTDQISLNFASVEYQYNQVDDRGQVLPIVTGYDLKQNKAL